MENEENKNEEVTEEITTSEELETNEIKEETLETNEDSLSEETEETTENISSEESEEIAETPQEVTSEQNNKVVQKNNKGIIIGIAAVVIVAAVYFIYSYINSPRNIFLKGINYGYKEVENLYDKMLNADTYKLLDKKALKSTASADINIKMEESLLDEDSKKVIDELNKLKIEAEVGYDKRNKKMSFVLNSKYDSDDLVGIGTYAKEKNLYLELKNIFDKYIEIPVEDYDALFENTKSKGEDGKYILKSFKKALAKNLDKKEFKKSKETVKVNGKEMKVTKVEYGLSQKTTMTLTKDILTDLKDDAKFIEKLSNILGKDKKEVKEQLTSMIEEIAKGLEDENVNTTKFIKISIYAKGITSKVVGFSVKVVDTQEYQIAYFKNGKVKETKISQDKTDLINIVTTEKDKNNSKTIVNISGLKMTIDKKVSGEKTTYDYNLNQSGVSLKGSFVITSKEVKKNEKYKSSIQFTMSLGANGMSLMSMEVNSTGISEYVDELKLPDTSNKVNYISLTEDDYNKMMTKLSQNENLMNLINNLGGNKE